MELSLPRGRAGRGGLRPGLVLPALVGVAVILAWQPWLGAGVVLGSLLLWVTVTWPLAVLGIMLALGPVDLAFLTGGFKGLFPQLGGLDMNGIRLVGISLGFAWVVLRERGALAAMRRPEVRLWLLFLGYVAASLAWSPDPLQGVRLLFKLAYPVLVFLMVTAPGRTEVEVRRLADWILIGAALIVVLNPFYVLGGGYELDFEGRVRLRGMGVHENPFSFYLLVIVLMSLGRFVARGQRRYLLLVVGAAVWMALTLTRITVGASLVGLCGMAFYGAVVAKSYRVAIGGVAVAALMGLALSPMVLARSFGYVPTLEELWSLARNPLALYQAVNWQGRQLFWPLLVQAWSSAPVFGLGLGAANATLADAFTVAWAPHNEYLRVGTDAGWLGLALVVAAAVSWFRATLRSARGGSAAVREFAFPAIAAMLAAVVVSITDNTIDYYTPFTQFIGFLVGATVVVHRLERERAAATLPADPG